MGNEQSVDSRAVPGFNPADSVHTKNSPTGRHRGKKGNKDDVGRVRDDFFHHAEVKDHITPIYDDGKRRKERDSGDLQDDIDMRNLLDQYRKKKESSEEDLAMDYDQAEEGESEETDEEDGERGMFHHEVQHQESMEKKITDSRSHPIGTYGDASVGCEIRCLDQSDWRNAFPIHKFQWFISSEIGSQVRFAPFPAGESERFVLPPESVGKYVRVEATRRVEDQFVDTYLRDEEGGVYDAHVKKARHRDLGLERRFVDVKSIALIGPILIADVWAYAILKSLSRACLESAVKLRDEPMDPQNTNLDESGGRNRGVKIAGYFKVDYEFIEFQYEQPKQRVAPSTTLFSADWVSRLVAIFTGKDDQQRENEKKKALQGPVKFKSPLSEVVFRPSVLSSTLVVGLALRKFGFSSTKKVQDIIRVDIDPKIGRDLVLYTVLAFQAAVEHGRVRPEDWQQSKDEGDTDLAKNIVQRKLEDLTTIASESAPAYEEQPETPWDY